MATMNPFDLLVDNDNDDPSQLIETASARLQKVAFKKTPAQAPQTQQQKSAKLLSKPLPPAQAVREAKSETGRGGGRGFGRSGGYGRGGTGGGYGRSGGSNRDYNNEDANSNAPGLGAQGEQGEGGKPSERWPYGGPRGPYRGRRGGGFNNDEGRDGERPRRNYERPSGTGRGYEVKREGSGRANWGATDEFAPGAEEVGEANEKKLSPENVPGGEDAVDDNKEGQPNEAVEKEPEEKEMTLEEYQKLLEEKRKALLMLKTEERKVELDKELKSMQQLSSKKDDESVFIKLDKKKEATEKEKVKKSVSINEFLKPAQGERYYGSGGRGRGGRGGRGSSRGGGYTGGRRASNVPAPSIEDPGQFPTLGAK